MSSRANLATIVRPIDLLPTLQPLAGKPRPDPDEPDDDDDESPVPMNAATAVAMSAGPQAVPAATYLVRAKPRSERLISSTVRLPLWMTEELERLDVEQGIEKSTTIRAALEAHLRNVVHVAEISA